MKLLVLFLCVIGSSLADNLAEASEASSSKTSSKSSLNAIPTGPAQKTTLLQPTHNVQVSQQPQSQYYPQYVIQKHVPVPQQPPAAMLIIAQPGSQQGTHSPLFQQAVQQLLSYYNNNPQAKYQLLQQQQGSGIPSGQSQQVYHQPAFPSGAIHVIPSPQLDNSNVQHAPTAPAGAPSQQTPQATYVIPAQSLQTLSTLNPALLAQLTGQSSAQHIPAPVQFSPHQIVPQQFQAQFNPGHFLTQQIPQFAQQIQSPQFSLPPQFSNFPSQGHVQAQFPANIQFGSSAPAQIQLGSKQQTQNVNNNEFAAQTEKSHQSSSSSSYNPVYRTAYVKG